MTRIPFTLQDFQRTGLAETRDGREARFVSYDKSRSVGVQLHVMMSDTECTIHYFSDGAFWLHKSDDNDLIHVLTKEPTMNELKPEYLNAQQTMALRVAINCIFDSFDTYTRNEAFDDIAKAVADRPRVELTDEQISEIYAKSPPATPAGFCDKYMLAAIKAVLATHDARPYVSEAVAFDLTLWGTGEWEALFEGKPTDVISLHTLLEIPCRYTMRRKS